MFDDRRACRRADEQADAAAARPAAAASRATCADRAGQARSSAWSRRSKAAGADVAVRRRAMPRWRRVGHEERLERVIGHLVQNAIDATRRSGGCASASAREGRTGAIIEVADTGSGMTPGVRPRAPVQAVPDHQGDTAWASALTRAVQYVQELGGRSRSTAARRAAPAALLLHAVRRRRRSTGASAA